MSVHAVAGDFGRVLLRSGRLLRLPLFRELVMRIWSRRKSQRKPVELIGHTGYATDEGRSSRGR